MPDLTPAETGAGDMWTRPNTPTGQFANVEPRPPSGQREGGTRRPAAAHQAEETPQDGDFTDALARAYEHGRRDAAHQAEGAPGSEDVAASFSVPPPVLGDDRRTDAERHLDALERAGVFQGPGRSGFAPEWMRNAAAAPGQGRERELAAWLDTEISESAQWVTPDVVSNEPYAVHHRARAQALREVRDRLRALARGGDQEGQS